jgi:mono/diheme cytochrome c family protein
MAEFMLLGLFDNVSITSDVIEEMRQLGVKDNDVTILSNIPYAPEYFGRKPPHQRFLPWVLGGVLLGIALGAFIAIGTPALYPLHVGAQSHAPFPPSAFIFFEVIALSTIIVSFIGFVVQNRFPVLTKEMYDERITDGYLGVQVLAQASQVDPIVKIFEAHHARVVKREDAAPYRPKPLRYFMFLGAAGTGGLVLLLIPLLLTYDVVRIPWVNTMKDSVAVGAQEGPRRAAPAESIPIQGPVLIAGQPASEPLPATDASLERGKILFGINCSMCHGLKGDLQDAEVGKYFPEIPALIGDQVQSLSDQQIFLTITNGRNRMPSLAENLTPGDTWDIINYVRSLAGQ